MASIAGIYQLHRHAVDGSLAGRQGAPVQDAYRRLLLQSQVVDRCKFGHLFIGDVVSWPTDSNVTLLFIFLSLFENAGLVFWYNLEVSDGYVARSAIYRLLNEPHKCYALTRSTDTCYPHMSIGKGMDISFTVCLFVRLRISPLKLKLATSHFARRFIGVQGRELQIFVRSAPTEAQNRTNRPARWPRPPACKHYRRDAPT